MEKDNGEVAMSQHISKSLLGHNNYSLKKPTIMSIQTKRELVFRIMSFGNHILLKGTSLSYISCIVSGLAYSLKGMNVREWRTMEYIVT